jgi:hypothetical protein
VEHLHFVTARRAFLDCVGKLERRLVARTDRGVGMAEAQDLGALATDDVREAGDSKAGGCRAFRISRLLVIVSSWD